MEITLDKYVEELNKCMQMHPDYIEGHHVKVTYLKRSVKLYDAEDNKIESSLSKVYFCRDLQKENLARGTVNFVFTLNAANKSLL